MKADVRIFVEVLMKLLDHGCTVRDALELMGKGPKHSFTSLAASRLLDRLSKGENLADALIACEIFHEKKELSFLSCFEKTGNIRPSLCLVLETEVRTREWKAAIIQSMLYPSTIILIAILSIVFLYVRGIPLMSETGFIRDSAVLDGMNRGIGWSAILLTLALAISITSIYFLLEDKKRKQLFWSTISILSAEDIPLDGCISLCEQSTGIPYDSKGDLYFFDSPKLDSYTRATLLSARLTGDFQNAFSAIASFHTDSMKSFCAAISRLMEPAGILVAGVVVLILSMTVFLPLFDSMGGIH